MKNSKWLIGSGLWLAMLLLSGRAEAQGYGFVRFSATGDTVVERTSFHNADKPDTVTTWFVISAKENGRFTRKSVLQVHEPDGLHGKDWACADFGKIPADTLKKYNLFLAGKKFSPNPKRFLVKTREIGQKDSTVFGQPYTIKTLEYQLLLDGKTFHTSSIRQFHNILKPKEIGEPRVAFVYPHPMGKKFFVEYTEEFNRFDPEEQRVMHVFSSHQTIAP